MLTEALRRRLNRDDNVGNFVFWAAFCILGQVGWWLGRWRCGHRVGGGEEGPGASQGHQHTGTVVQGWWQSSGLTVCTCRLLRLVAPDVAPVPEKLTAV